MLRHFLLKRVSKETNSSPRITKNPNLQFIIIINPHNGPGASSFPDEDYSREVPKLNVHSNVITVGYVHIDYCKRNLTEVFRDLAKYAGWAKHPTQSNLGLQGIFVDETPNLYSSSKASYLDAVSQYIKSSAGISGKRLVSLRMFIADAFYCLIVLIRSLYFPLTGYTQSRNNSRPRIHSTRPRHHDNSGRELCHIHICPAPAPPHFVAALQAQQMCLPGTFGSRREVGELGA